MQLIRRRKIPTQTCLLFSWYKITVIQLFKLHTQHLRTILNTSHPYTHFTTYFICFTMVLFPDSPAPKNQILTFIGYIVKTKKQNNKTWHRAALIFIDIKKKYITSLRRVSWEKKIVTILRFYNTTIYLNKNDTMLAYYSKQLLFTQMTAKISGMERPTISR